MTTTPMLQPACDASARRAREQDRLHAAPPERRQRGGAAELRDAVVDPQRRPADNAAADPRDVAAKTRRSHRERKQPADLAGRRQRVPADAADIGVREALRHDVRQRRRSDRDTCSTVTSAAAAPSLPCSAWPSTFSNPPGT